MRGTGGGGGVDKSIGVGERGGTNRAPPSIEYWGKGGYGARCPGTGGGWVGLKADVRKVQPPPPVPAPTMQSQRARPWARLARGGAVRMRLAVAFGMGSD
eukprot:scaffold13600_cov108-Isochrysis_galbana.AAC.1